MLIENNRAEKIGVLVAWYTTSLRAVKVGHGAIENARATLEQPGTQMNFGHKRPPSASYLKHFHDTLTNVASLANASELPSLFPDKLIAAVPAKHARCITFPDTLIPAVPGKHARCIPTL